LASPKYASSSRSLTRAKPVHSSPLELLPRGVPSLGRTESHDHDPERPAPERPASDRLGAVGIPARVLNELYEHARESAPEECCGLVVSERGHRYGRAVRCRNLMTQRHDEDPVTYPRDATAAYYMSESDVLAVSREVERSGGAVTAVYHSHVGAGAYLSELDLAYARHALFPFPHADQIVLSVLEHRVREMKIYLRSGDAFSEHWIEAEPS